MLTEEGTDGIDPAELEPFATRLLQATGAPAEAAAAVAESLVLSDLRGHNSHGTRRIPQYTDSIRGELDGVYTIDPSALPSVVSEGPTHAQIDGRFAFGQVVGREAVDLAVEKADENGVAMIGIRDATHLGRIGEWSERVADEGFVFSAFVCGQGGSLVAPPGSAQRRFGTNPVSFGIPTFDALDFPIMFDIATSQVAGGKTAEAAAKGAPLHEEWTVDSAGEPVTDAAAFRDGEGALLPVGGRASGYKGFGLAMVAELFSSIAGNGFVAAQTDHIRGNAAMFVAADPTLFSTRSEIEERITALEEYIDDTEFSPHVSAGHAAYGDRAHLPGEPEHRVEQDRRRDGIPLPERDIEELCELAVEHEVTDRIPGAFEGVVATDD